MNQQGNPSKTRDEKKSSFDKNQEDSAFKTLVQIRQKLFDLNDPPYSEHPSESTPKSNLKSTESSIRCIYCLTAVQNGDVLCSTPCCNSISHIQCIKSILQHEEIYHACPHCLTKVIPKFEGVNKNY